MKVKCACCNKKLDLTAFPCRCGGFYCPTHRPDVAHQCSYDYKSDYLKLASTTLIKVAGKKVDAI